MAVKRKQGQWELDRLPADLHNLAVSGKADEQAVYQNIYAAIWNEGGNHAELLPALHDAALAMMAVVGVENSCCDSLGPRPEGTNAIAMVALQMYRLLAAVRDGDADAAAKVRRVGSVERAVKDDPESLPGGFTTSPDYSTCVPSGSGCFPYQEVASQLADVAWQMLRGPSDPL